MAITADMGTTRLVPAMKWADRANEGAFNRTTGSTRVTGAAAATAKLSGAIQTQSPIWLSRRARLREAHSRVHAPSKSSGPARATQAARRRLAAAASPAESSYLRRGGGGRSAAAQAGHGRARRRRGKQRTASTG